MKKQKNTIQTRQLSPEKIEHEFGNFFNLQT
jgi:hypothetical protein